MKQISPVLKISTPFEKTEKALFEKFPDLFISVNIEGREVKVPKNRLKKLSPKFARMLDSGFREAQENRIVLELPPSDLGDREKVIDQFLNYLETGELDMTGDTALPLLNLAKEHDLPHLLSKAEVYIGENLELETLGFLLDFAIANDLTNLKWNCFIFASKQPGREQLLEGEQVSDEAKRIIRYGAELRASGIAPAFSEGQLKLTITKNSNLDDPTIQLLKQINENVLPVTSLELRKESLDDARLDQLANAVPNLDQLIIQSDKITSLPKQWCQSLKKVDCRKCWALKSLDLPKAEYVDCSYCTILKSLNSPKAKEVYCELCPYLKSLVLPEAEVVKCSECEVLETLDLPKAEVVVCNKCPYLTSLNSPEAKEVNCNDCVRLRRLNLPNAEYVDCGGTALRSLNLENAKKVYCKLCSFLTSLDLPQAEYVDCSKCPTLRNLDLQNAKEVNCNECLRLKSLKLPNAEEVYCYNTLALENIEVPSNCDLIGISNLLLTTRKIRKIFDFFKSFLRLRS